MSWDIIVQDVPTDAKCIAEIPDGSQSGPNGSRAHITGVIRRIVPFADFSDPSWLVIDGSDFSIEVGLGQEEELACFSFHVRGSDTAAGVVAEILDALGLRASDTSLGDFFRPDDAIESLRKWREYRAQVVAATAT